MSNMSLYTQPPCFRSSGAFAFSRSSNIICGCFQWLGPLERMSFTWKQIKQRNKQRKMEQNNKTTRRNEYKHVNHSEFTQLKSWCLNILKTWSSSLGWRSWLVRPLSVLTVLTARNWLVSSRKWRLLYLLVSMQKPSKTSAHIIIKCLMFGPMCIMIHYDMWTFRTSQLLISCVSFAFHARHLLDVPQFVWVNPARVWQSWYSSSTHHV